MGHKFSNQVGFADVWLGYNQNLNQQLSKIDQLVNWRPFQELLSKIYASPSGRPSHPVLLLFKGLLLQTWHNLSDYALEEALDDRLSFRRFASLSIEEKAPDHSVFSRFRSELVKHGIHELLFIELNRQLEEQKLIIKKGTLIDATIVEAAPRRPLHTEDGSAGKSEQDPEAAWTRKKQKSYFGFKAHVGVDQESELIRQAKITPGNVSDGKMLGNILCGDEKWVFADKGYADIKNDELLREKGIYNGIMFKASRTRALTDAQKSCNRILSKFRCSVERIFGTLKRTYQYRRVRYIGLLKNQLQLTMLCMAYNMKRMVKLCA